MAQRRRINVNNEAFSENHRAQINFALQILQELFNALSLLLLIIIYASC